MRIVSACVRPLRSAPHAGNQNKIRKQVNQNPKTSVQKNFLLFPLTEPCSVAFRQLRKEWIAPYHFSLWVGLGTHQRTRKTKSILSCFDFSHRTRTCQGSQKFFLKIKPRKKKSGRGRDYRFSIYNPSIRE